MPATPALWTLPIGALFGAAVYPPVGRWLALCHRLLLTAAGRRDACASRQKLKLALLALLAHPAPWLLLVGVPYAAHRLWSDPTAALWLWFAAGAVLGGAAAYAWERRSAPGTPPERT